MGYILKTNINSNTSIADDDDSDKVYFESAPVWTDKYAYPEQAGSYDDTIDGGGVLQIFPKSISGRPITLDGYLSVARLDSLMVKVNIGYPVLFSEDNGSSVIACYFDYSRDNPVEVEYIDEYKAFAKLKIYLRRA